MSGRPYSSSDLTALLKRLARSGGQLELHGERIVLRVGRRSTVVCPALVRSAVSDGVLAETPDGYELTVAGRNALRRSLTVQDPFQQQHGARRFGEVRGTDGRATLVAISDGASLPLSWLRGRKSVDGKPLISSAQYEAGSRLSDEFERGCQTPRVTANWSVEGRQKKGRKYGAAPGKTADLQGNAAAAQERIRAALDAVGPELSGILIDVCCHHQGLSEAEKLQGFPQRSGKTVLGLALSALARHYRIPDDEVPRRPMSSSRLFWRDEDAVPR